MFLIDMGHVYPMKYLTFWVLALISFPFIKIIYTSASSFPVYINQVSFIDPESGPGPKLRQVPVATLVPSSNSNLYATVWYDPTEVLIAEQIRLLPSNHSIPNYGSIAVTDIENEIGPVHGNAESTECVSCPFNCRIINLLVNLVIRVCKTFLALVLMTFEYLFVPLQLVIDFLSKVMLIGLVFLLCFIACVFSPIGLIFFVSYSYLH